jgi:uncharacterized protein YodC (DUF2158 family)
MDKFNKGDTVMLNGSESPVMTVSHYSAPNDNKVFCEWFLNGMVQAHFFYETSLKHWEPEKKERLGPDLHLI